MFYCIHASRSSDGVRTLCIYDDTDETIESYSEEKLAKLLVERKDIKINGLNVAKGQLYFSLSAPNPIKVQTMGQDLVFVIEKVYMVGSEYKALQDIRGHYVALTQRGFEKVKNSGMATTDLRNVSFRPYMSIDGKVGVKCLTGFGSRVAVFIDNLDTKAEGYFMANNGYVFSGEDKYRSITPYTWYGSSAYGDKFFNFWIKMRKNYISL